MVRSKLRNNGEKLKNINRVIKKKKNINNIRKKKYCFTSQNITVLR